MSEIIRYNDNQMIGIFMRILILLSVFFLASCAPSADERLADISGLGYQMKVSGVDVITDYHVQRATHSTMGQLYTCLRSQTANDLLTGTAPESVVTPRTVIASGVVTYLHPTDSRVNQYYVKYHLTGQLNEGGVSYQFSQLQQVQSNKSTLPRYGFNEIGNWPGANPLEVIAALTQVVDRSEHCLAQ